MAATPKCNTDEAKTIRTKKCIVQRKCCLLTAIVVSKACLIVEDEHSFQASDKYLVAAQTDTVIYLEWPSSSLSGNTHPV